MEIVKGWFKPNPQALRSLLERRKPGPCLFTQLLHKEGIELTQEDITNGKFCFYGSLLLSLCFGSHLPSLHEPLFSYSLLYVLIDSFLDKPKLTENKKDTLCHLYALLEGEAPPSGNAFLSRVNKHYTRLLEYKPAIRGDLLKIFLVELESVSFQSSPQHTEEEFMHMCRKKGALSLRALFTLNGKQGEAVSRLGDTASPSLETRSDEEIGFCIQLLDDLYDVFLDKEEKIHTIATYHLTQHGNCDRLYMFTLERIESLPSRFILLQTTMMAFAVCLAQNVPCLSSSLKGQIEPFFFLPPGVQLSSLL
ncbi:Hypothetical protein BRZCDTV_226 [Brazilian cedratvirus IHUMI]|uniref:Uncharacterized protein n=1 Tax=Brazilian cedratvirus IHUMI TaxID=2126980 RepID=A0A2R8FE07_9VIRU|nr:Hypothetical protein BRZCDTV_226 [Brazilian cedratvirus IHUMI]